MMERSIASRGGRAPAMSRRLPGASVRGVASGILVGALMAVASTGAFAGSPAGKGTADAATGAHAGKTGGAAAAGGHGAASGAHGTTSGAERGTAPPPLIAALMASTAGIEAAAAAAKAPLVTEGVPPSPWAAESCDRWRREGFMNCLRQLDANPRLILLQSVTWIDDEQIDRAKRGARLLELRLEPSQAREINAWCTDRATQWAQSSSKACQ